jgi:hypothetical protein
MTVAPRASFLNAQSESLSLSLARNLEGRAASKMEQEYVAAFVDRDFVADGKGLCHASSSSTPVTFLTLFTVVATFGTF